MLKQTVSNKTFASSALRATIGREVKESVSTVGALGAGDSVFTRAVASL